MNGDKEKFEVFSTLHVHTDTEIKEIIVAVRQGPVLGTAFHPELTQDNRLHEWWIKEIVIPAWNARKKDLAKMYTDDISVSTGHL